MVVKTLQVFYGADNLPYKDQERKIHFPIVSPAFQGSSQVNEVKFYVDSIGGANAQWVACVKLPNGKLGYKVLETDDDELGTFALFTLSSWFTQMKGDLYISLKGYAGGAEIIYDSESEIYKVSGDPIIQSTGAIKLTIQYATPIEESEYPDTFEEVLALIYTKLDKNSDRYLKIIDDIANINSAENADYLNGGDIVFSLADKRLYKLIATYPHLTIAEGWGGFWRWVYRDTLLSSLQNISQFVILEGDYYYLRVSYSSQTGYSFTMVNLVSGIKYQGIAYAYQQPNIQTILSSSRNDYIDQQNTQTINGTKTFTTLNVKDNPSTTDITTYKTLGVSTTQSDTTYELTFPASSGTFATQEWTDNLVATYIASVYKPQGSASVSELNALTKASTMNGYVYNVSNAGTLTNRDSTTLSVNIGDNVVFIWNDGSWYWDDLAGIVDLSGYVQKTQTIAGITLDNNISAQDLTDALIYASSSDIEGIMED